TAAAPSAPSQAQRARGAATGQAAGASGRAETATTDRSGSAQAMAVWGSQIRARVERARRHPGTGSGTAVVAFTLSREGALLAVQVAQSSGHAALDRAALEAVRRAAPFPPAPDGIRAAQSTFNLPVAFRR
ncbi:MAG: energy transducer TonB, partial [Rhodobacteraceae bacterium]|nr:energy transducer TonB [Paracoccaceae bacterium]